MVSYWSLSDSKSPPVSMTLLSILTIFNNAVVWMVSTRPVISKSSSLWINPSVTVPRAPITIGIIVTFMFHSFFNSLGGRVICPSFHILSISFCGQPGQQSPQFCKFSFFVDYYKVWSSGRDLVIYLYVKIPEEFMCIILQNTCCVVQRLTHPFVSSLILFLC